MHDVEYTEWKAALHLLECKTFRGKLTKTHSVLMVYVQSCISVIFTAKKKNKVLFLLLLFVQSILFYSCTVHLKKMKTITDGK